MPKLKTHKGAKKRFKRTGTGKLLAKRGLSRHNLTNKKRDNLRKKKALFVMDKSNQKYIDSLLAS